MSVTCLSHASYWYDGFLIPLVYQIWRHWWRHRWQGLVKNENTDFFRDRTGLFHPLKWLQKSSHRHNIQDIHFPSFSEYLIIWRHWWRHQCPWHCKGAWSSYRSCILSRPLTKWIFFGCTKALLSIYFYLFFAPPYWILDKFQTISSKIYWE